MTVPYEPQPTCPADWQGQYALSAVVGSVPVKEDSGTKDTVSLDMCSLLSSTEFISEMWDGQ